jgi:hypothetical protein
MGKSLWRGGRGFSARRGGVCFFRDLVFPAMVLLRETRSVSAGQTLRERKASKNLGKKCREAQMDIPHEISESDVQLQVTEFPSGNRDYCLFRQGENGERIPVNPLELLGLDRAAGLIEEEKQQNAPKAMNLALCRLLVPSLQTSRFGRHLIVEPWSEEAIRGDTLAEETRTPFAQKLARAQADEYRVVTTGEKTPKGTLAELVWDAVTELPKLPPQFDNPILGKFSKALFFHLVPEGEGRAELEWSDISKEIRRCRRRSFAQLQLDVPGRELRRLYRTLMAVTVRWMSKLTGQLAEELIDEMRDDSRPLRAEEVAMRDLRYGAAANFGKINVGFLFECGPLFATFFNNIFQSIADGAPQTAHDAAIAESIRYTYLYRTFLWHRKYARKEEKYSRREKYQDRPPEGRKRKPAEDVLHAGGRTSVDDVITMEEMRLLKDEILPELDGTKPDYTRLVRQFIDNNGDLEAAATASGLPKHILAQRLRKTVFPAVRRTAKKLGYHSILDL